MYFSFPFWNELNNKYITEKLWYIIHLLYNYRDVYACTSLSDYRWLIKHFIIMCTTTEGDEN